MKLPKINKDLSKLLVLTDQAIVSGGNFMLGIVLIRLLGLKDYGLFAMLWMGVLFALSLHQAFITKPMMTLAIGQSEEEQAHYFSTLGKIQLTFGGVVGSFFCGVIFLLNHTRWSIGWMEYLPMIGGITCLYLLQDFYKKTFFIKKIFSQPLIMDSLCYGMIFIGLFGLMLTNNSTLSNVLMVIAVGYLTSIPFYVRELEINKLPKFCEGIFSLDKAKNADDAGHRRVFLTQNKGKKTSKMGRLYFSKSLRDLFQKYNLVGQPSWLGLLKKHYHFSSWLLGTSILQWFSGNFFLITAASILGTTAVGAVRMGQNIVGLCHIIFLAMENIVPVEAAQRFLQKDFKVLQQYLVKITLKIGGIVTAVLLAMSLLASLLIEGLYGAAFTSYSYVVWGYCLLYVFVFVGYPMRYFFRTIQFTQPIFIAYCISAFFSIILAFPMVQNWGIMGLLVGLMISQILTLLVYTYYTFNKTKQENSINLTLLKR